MELQRLYSYVRQAMEEYDMVADGDKVAIGISGGKDSLTLLYALAGLRKFYPKKFDIAAITVDLGYEDFDLTEIYRLCETLDVEYQVEHTAIRNMVKDGECSLCARLRKGALNELAGKMNCNKIAYAHNMDDVVETMMLSLIYEGRFSTFWPVTHFEDSNLDVIRPLIYVPLAKVIGFKNKYELPVTKNPCPYDGVTERTYVRELLSEINNHAPDVKKRMMTAIKNGNLEGWHKQERTAKPFSNF